MISSAMATRRLNSPIISQHTKREKNQLSNVFSYQLGRGQSRSIGHRWCHWLRRRKVQNRSTATIAPLQDTEPLTQEPTVTTIEEETTTATEEQTAPLNEDDSTILTVEQRSQIQDYINAQNDILQYRYKDVTGLATLKDQDRIKTGSMLEACLMLDWYQHLVLTMPSPRTIPTMLEPSFQVLGSNCRKPLASTQD